MKLDSPHPAIPFTFGKYVEQDSRDEIVQSMWTILSYELGERTDEPSFGISDQALRMNGADIEEMRRALLRWEPRARPILEREPGLINDLIDRIDVRPEADNG
jgi:hypothetical protein